MEEHILSNIKKEPLEETDINIGLNGEIPSNADTKKIIYELSADATITFPTGESIKVNKTMLAFNSPIFAEMFFGLSRGNNIEIHEYDCQTFKTFLDCLFGFKEYTAADALQIYPIAYKFKVQKFLDECKIKLAPCLSSEMSENVCLTLNLALLYNCDELVNAVMKYLENSFGILNLFEKKDFFFLLEPVSVLKIIEYTKMNSFVIEILYKWGLNYIEKNSRVTDIRLFFDDNKIYEKISLNYFESVSSILKFHNDSNMKMFTSDEILIHMGNALKNPRNFPSNSEWVKISKGDIVKEKINFQHALCVNSNNSEIMLKVWRNSIFYEFVLNKENEADSAIDFDISYAFQKQYCQHHCRHKSDLCNSEVSLFYTKLGTLKDNTGKRCAKVLIKNLICNIVSVDITYTFHIDCRILKTSLDVIPLAVDDNELYFTCGVQIC